MESDYGAFMEKFTLSPSSSSGELSLTGLNFAVKEIFDVEGFVTGFGNPDWARTHTTANSTAPAVLALLRAGATCVGRTVMDEMAYSINGENIHYGTPRNPCSADRVPGGSSSGSAVAVGANIVDFSLGWFARDPAILKRVGDVLLPTVDAPLANPSSIIFAEDCFKLLNIPIDRVKQVLVNTLEKLFGGQVLKYMDIGNYVEENVSSLKHFMSQGGDAKEYSIPSLVALSSAMRLLQRYEFKINHGEWVSSTKPILGPGINERVWEAVRATDDKIDICHSVRTELRAALASLLGDVGILAIPTVPGPPPKLQTEPSTLETFRARAFSLLSIAGVSGFCQVSIPLGLYDDLPVSVSLLAKHGSDMFLMSLVENLCPTLKEHIDAATRSSL
ncbi:amidase 1 isoform X2 [Beta vulgaris subsp. vulgaris]|uniref:amidase 1 isoform X2 n=1 Tax=Beta vulgaris subsp. vulgaris TaxID=3555 RepID=UPI0025492B65|nr:amidase 1 isoform X2 [Beta vulgaris subsp. vulgaris]